ncbi:lipase family protein [Nocardia halotolerans]|uniref:Lipase family protein n=1 Tax=Nocardia halotolerans TaxID=1755878 RepID=A0ABV8VE17_9NOCA
MVSTVLTPAVVSHAATDDFFVAGDGIDLASLAPGTVLKTRTLKYHVVGVDTPMTAVQVLYRSTNALGEPVANVTSIVRPPASDGSKVVSFQSMYDSLNPADSPSRAIAGDVQIGGATTSGSNIAGGSVLVSGETAAFAPLLAQGYTVVIPDTEGPGANFAAGPEYGLHTLFSLRAARSTPETGISGRAEIGLMGYSGGAIATNWAAILAPAYAPDIEADLVGAAEGGVLVAPANNLRYANGSLGWAGVVGMAVVGIARSYGIDFTRYLNDFGRQTVARLQDASILNVFLQYPGLTWQQMALPEFSDPNSVPEFVAVVNELNMGLAPIPNTSMFIAQGSNGILEGTIPGGPGIGDGDGIMVTGDVRALANRYCEAGVTVQYDQYDFVSHAPALMIWAARALQWLNDRFRGAPAPSNCGAIASGNPIVVEQLR